nr:CPPV347 hypothetical protein [Cooks petrelpox virus]
MNLIIFFTYIYIIKIYFTAYYLQVDRIIYLHITQYL